MLLKKARIIRVTELKSSEFFKKLAGYDTLRLVLSNKAILVEGDSDELIVQRAYMDANGGRLPIEDSIDVISVGTSFLRFLELAVALEIAVAVVTDSDGKPDAVKKKYAEYENKKNIRICYDEIVDGGDLMLNEKKPFNYNTLEPKMLKANNLETINKILGKNLKTVDEMHIHMHANKTEVALEIFSAKAAISYPEFIKSAIAI